MGAAVREAQFLLLRGGAVTTVHHGSPQGTAAEEAGDASEMQG